MRWHTQSSFYTLLDNGWTLFEIILGMSSANERLHYIVTALLICWAHTQNNLCFLNQLPLFIYFSLCMVIETTFTCYKSHSYLSSITAAWLQWHLSIWMWFNTSDIYFAKAGMCVSAKLINGPLATPTFILMETLLVQNYYKVGQIHHDTDIFFSSIAFE